jgi:hypothetical protein
VGSYIDIISRLSTEEIFLQNDFEEMVLRSTPGPGGKFYARFPGKLEFEIFPEGSIIHDTLGMAKEISRREYYHY